VSWLLVFVFGGLGALARVGIAGLFPVRTLPWGTLLVNAVGCLLIGVAFQWFESRTELSLALRTALVGGFLGGFTTFSAFGLETWQMLQDGQLGWAAAYVGGSVVIGILAVAAGIVLARQL
jgi:CrcB protein